MVAGSSLGALGELLGGERQRAYMPGGGATHRRLTPPSAADPSSTGVSATGPTPAKGVVERLQG